MNTLNRLALMCAIAIAPCTAGSVPPPTDEAHIGVVREGILKGYLAPQALPDSKGLLPAPPPMESKAAEADWLHHQEALGQVNSARWRAAAQDADLSAASVLSAFDTELGFTPSQATTPHLAVLLRRVMTDAGMATVSAKNAYTRERPFAASKTATCTPSEDASLAKNGSYPSGHASIGWAWALVLAEVAPESAPAALKRGLEFGESRVTCLAHWRSDVEAGRVVGAAVVAALHGDPLFRAQVDAAKEEVTRQRSTCATAGAPQRASALCAGQN